MPCQPGPPTLNTDTFTARLSYQGGPNERCITEGIQWDNRMTTHIYHWTQSLGLLKNKKEKISRGVQGMLPRKILKVETKICAIWGILEANLKKSITLKFIMNISFVPSVCINRSFILIFIEKKVCMSIFFPQKNFFPTISIFISARILVSVTNSRPWDLNRKEMLTVR